MLVRDIWAVLTRISSVKHVPDWFPGAGFKKTAKLYRQTAVQLRDGPYEAVKQQVVRNVPSNIITLNRL